MALAFITLGTTITDAETENLSKARDLFGDLLSRRTSLLLRVSTALQDAMPSLPLVDENGELYDGRRQRTHHLNPTLTGNSLRVEIQVGGHGVPVCRVNGRDEVIYDEQVMFNIHRRVLGVAANLIALEGRWLEDADTKIVVRTAVRNECEASLILTITKR